MAKETHKRTILIVDDVLENLHILSQLLKKQGYAVQAIETGREALDAANEHVPDLILLDIVLPDIDGFEVCTQLKKNPLTSTIPVIFISALTQTKDILKGFSVGGIDYITKPFIVEEILARVSAHMEMSIMSIQLKQQAAELQQLNRLTLEKSKAETQEKTNDLSVLKNASSILLEIDSKEGIYKYIEESIYPISGANYMIINEYDHQTRSAIVNKVIGPKSTIQNIQSVLGRDLNTLHFPLDDLVNQRKMDLRKNIYPVRGGIYELSANKIPKAISFGVEKILGINELYSASFIWDEKFYGGITFAFKKGKQFNKMLLVNAIIHQVSMAISRINTKEKLQLSEETYRSIFENTGNATMIVDENTKVVLANEEFINVTGYSPEQVIGTSWTNYVALESLDILKQYSELRRKKPTEAPNRLEASLIHSNGTIRDVILNIGLIPFTNNSVVSLLDITDLKRAEVKVLKLSRAVEQSPISILITDTKGIIEYCNPKIAEISGYSINELIGVHSKIFASGEKTKTEYAKLWDTISSGNEWKGEFHNKKKNGDLYWEKASISPILNEKGKITHYLAVKEDITEKKLANQALRDSEYRYQTLATISPVGIFRTNANGSTTYVNPTWSKISGLSAEEAMGDGWLNRVHPEDRAKLHENWQKSIKNELVSLSEYRFLRPDKSIAWVIGQAVPELNTKGELIGYVGTATDISEHKKLEKTKDILVNVSNAVLATESLRDFSSYIFDELRKVIETNNFYIALYNEETQMISTPFIADALDEEITEFPIAKTMTGFVIHTRKTQLINKKRFVLLEKSGELELVGPPSDVWIGVPLFINEKVVGAIVIQNYEGEKRLDEEDLKVLEYAAPQISLAIERKNAFEKLKVALEKAQASDRLKTAFMNNISHEIRTPLNGILGYAPFIFDPDISQEEKESFLETLNSSSERLMNTVTDYIDISLLASGSLETISKTVVLSTLMKDVYELFQMQCMRKNLDFKLKMPEKSDSIVLKTDERLLRKTLEHLINNAVKFTKSGSIEIGYRIITGARTDEAELFIKDSGHGIAKTAQKIIFEPFMQETIANTRGYEGSGLGLSIAKGITELLHGRIHLESQIDVGTNVYVTLPLEEKSLIPKAQPKIQKKHQKQTLKILIAEDDEISESLLKIILRAFTQEVLFAKNGTEAIEIAENNPDIDLIMMDIKMPGINGFAATRKIRQFNADVIIIAQTAYAEIGQKEKAIDAGCNDYISKPIQKEKLTSLINTYFYSE